MYARRQLQALVRRHVPSQERRRRASSHRSAALVRAAKNSGADRPPITKATPVPTTIRKAKTRRMFQGMYAHVRVASIHFSTLVVMVTCSDGCVLPNGPRLSCGALKKDAFLNLRAPSASSAC